MNHATFPFSAVVGQHAMKSALLAASVDPSIGGVLIRGEKGTAKSTIVRAFRELLPSLTVVRGCPYHCPPAAPVGLCPECTGGAQPTATDIPVPLVELPLGATEDRLVGTLDVEAALSSGVRKFDAGLLAAANRGILYVDEVNLLED
ncbi:MAG: magnesium chelatase ATPase subunit I, partial [Spirochaetaceae bacterium]